MRSSLIAPAALLLAASAAFAQPADLARALPGVALGDARIAPGEEPTELLVSWSGGEPWIRGVNFDGEAFGGGLSRGRNFIVGNATTTAADDIPVEIVFDTAIETVAWTFDASNAWNSVALGTFRGAAYDVSDPAAPRRLNVVLTARSSTARGANGVWDPDGSTQGNLEFLGVMSTTYDGTGGAYGGESFLSSPLDLVYVLAARETGAGLYATTATMAVETTSLTDFAVVSDGEAMQLSWAYDRPEGSEYVVYRADGDDEVEIARLPRATRALEHVPPSTDALYAWRVEVVDASDSVIARSRTVEARLGVAENARLVGQWGERGSWADVWGYTAPDGREYALVALQALGFSVVDVTEDTPVEVGFVPTLAGASDSKDVKVHDRFAYLVNEIGPMQIVDLADPTNPVQVGTLDTQPGIPQGGAHNAWIDSGRLYVTGGRSPGGLRIYSLADPAAPALLSRIEPFYYHDLYVSGDRGYASGIYGDGVDVLDLSDPSNPTRLGLFNYPGSGAHNVCTTEDGRYAFVGDEIGSAGNWTRVFEVSDPQDAEYVTDIVVDSRAVTHNCYVVGDLLYIGHYTEGLQVFDVSDPRAPVRAAYYDTFQPPTYGFDGVWSVFPYFASGKILVSDRNSGLYVVRLGDRGTASEPAAVEPGLSLALAPNPTRGASAVRVRLAGPAHVRVSVHDLLGRQVALAHDAPLAAGESEVPIDAATLGAGTYLVRVDGGPAGVRSAPLTVVR